MSASTAQATTHLIDSFADSAPGHLEAEFRRLVQALWSDGALTDLAPAAVPELVGRLEQVDDARKGYLAVLLGMLIEADHPGGGGEVTALARQGLDLYLRLWVGSANGRPLSLALAYLLGHFPEDRDRILAVAPERGLDVYDLSKLDRALRRLDPDDPVIGRVFPSPAVWALMDEAERHFDNSWIKKLSAEEVLRNWDNDTRTVLANLGAMAYWAVSNGAPEPVEVGTVPPRDTLQAPPDADIELFARHADAFRCPHCHGGLSFQGDEVGCAECSATYPIASGILNLTEGADRNAGDFLYKLAEVPSMGHFYEAYARPNFLRLAGSNWGAAVTPADEDAYIAEHVRPVTGPVLDLAAGAGRWTEVLAKAVGAERVIALDMYPPMLTALRRRLPEVPAVMAGARELPFRDASLGAVLCWNALQAFPDDAATAIAEVGRCLRPGGTFTFMTFRTPSDPLYRYFQSCHFFPGHQGGLDLFEVDDLKAWLADAGLVVRQEAGPGTFVLVTAERAR